MNILGIDPGNTQSAWVVYDTENKGIIVKGIEDNERLLGNLRYMSTLNVKPFIEMVASYGMTVGKEVFDTVFWIGQFYREMVLAEMNPSLIYRKEVKLILCNDLRAKDKNIRQACLDRLGKDRCKGIAKDIWSALAICLTVESINNLQDWKLLKEKLP
jgi:hypothetical protein